MARTRTLLNLLTDVADRADIDVPSTSTFITKTTATRWLNQSARRFVGMLIATYGEDYYSTTTTITTASGTAEYPLPADFFQLDYFRVSLYGYRYNIPRAQKDMIDRDPVVNTGWGAPNKPFYRIVGSKVIFTPTPLGIYTVTMRYVGTAVLFDNSNAAITDLSADTDYIDGVNGWEEWIVLDCARKALVRAERDTSAVEREMAEIAAEIQQQAQNRTRDGERVRDVYRGGSPGNTWDGGDI